MEQLTHSHAVEIHWHSYELRPKGAPPISPEYLARIQEGRPRLYAIARENYGLELKPGPFGIDTRPALIGAKYAEAQNLGAAYHDRIMQAYWQQEAKLDDLEQLATLAQDAGLDRQEFQAALSDPAYDQQVQEDIDTAASYGLSGVPALVFDNKYLVSGAQPLNVLQQVLAQIEKQRTE